MLPLLEAYFGTPYPFDKLDLTAVPLFGGAMENAGLITFGRGLILAKPQEDSIARQRRFATVLAHELAHMWFGDLVTLAWWDDAWLNESFANWMEYKIVEQWRPGWEVPLQRVGRRNRAMAADSLISARRVRQPVESKDDMANAFDTITYNKGSSVLVMFEGWIGADTFRRGIQRYLSRHAYGRRQGHRARVQKLPRPGRSSARQRDSVMPRRLSARPATVAKPLPAGWLQRVGPANVEDPHLRPLRQRVRRVSSLSGPRGGNEGDHARRLLPDLDHAQRRHGGVLQNTRGPGCGRQDGRWRDR
jgi:hypothetical protein